MFIYSSCYLKFNLNFSINHKRIKRKTKNRVKKTLSIIANLPPHSQFIAASCGMKILISR